VYKFTTFKNYVFEQIHQKHFLVRHPSVTFCMNVITDVSCNVGWQTDVHARGVGKQFGWRHPRCISSYYPRILLDINWRKTSDRISINLSCEPPQQNC